MEADGGPGQSREGDAPGRRATASPPITVTAARLDASEGPEICRG